VSTSASAARKPWSTFTATTPPPSFTTPAARPVRMGLFQVSRMNAGSRAETCAFVKRESLSAVYR
jgi:hypothetical protein